VSRLRRRSATRLALYGALLFGVLWSIRATVVADTDWDRIGGPATVARAAGRFAALDVSLIPQLLEPTLVTLMIACLSTAVAVVLCLPVTWFAARNITPSPRLAYPLGRIIISLSRSTHEIVWGLIFVSAVGLGAFPGILAIAVRSVGFLAKTAAEAVEHVDPRPIEAIRAVGGDRLQVIAYGMLPQVLPVFLGHLIFQWDINIRRSTVMGLVGAGGLGLTLHRQFVMYNYAGVTTVILAIFVLVALGEVISYSWRRAII